MIEKNNDTCYSDISEIIGKYYKPKTGIKPEIGRKIMDDLKIDEETDTIISGSYREWVELICFIIDKLKEYQENDKEECEMDLTKIGQSFSQTNGIMSIFITKYINSIGEYEIPEIINLKGRLENFDRFYEIVSEMEKQRTNHVGEK